MKGVFVLFAILAADGVTATGANTGEKLIEVHKNPDTLQYGPVVGVPWVDQTNLNAPPSLTPQFYPPYTSDESNTKQNAQQLKAVNRYKHEMKYHNPKYSRRFNGLKDRFDIYDPPFETDEIHYRSGRRQPIRPFVYKKKHSLGLEDDSLLFDDQKPYHSDWPSYDSLELNPKRFPTLSEAYNRERDLKLRSAKDEIDLSDEDSDPNDSYYDKNFESYKRNQYNLKRLNNKERELNRNQKHDSEHDLRNGNDLSSKSNRLPHLRAANIGSDNESKNPNEYTKPEETNTGLRNILTPGLDGPGVELIQSPIYRIKISEGNNNTDLKSTAQIPPILSSSQYSENEQNTIFDKKLTSVENEKVNLNNTDSFPLSQSSQNHESDTSDDNKEQTDAEYLTETSNTQTEKPSYQNTESIKEINQNLGFQSKDDLVRNDSNKLPKDDGKKLSENETKYTHLNVIENKSESTNKEYKIGENIKLPNDSDLHSLVQESDEEALLAQVNEIINILRRKNINKLLDPYQESISSTKQNTLTKTMYSMDDDGANKYDSQIRLQFSPTTSLPYFQNKESMERKDYPSDQKVDNEKVIYAQKFLTELLTALESVNETDHRIRNDETNNHVENRQITNNQYFDTTQPRNNLAIDDIKNGLMAHENPLGFNDLTQNYTLDKLNFGFNGKVDHVYYLDQEIENKTESFSNTNKDNDPIGNDDNIISQILSNANLSEDNFYTKPSLEVDENNIGVEYKVDDNLPVQYTNPTIGEDENSSNFMNNPGQITEPANYLNNIIPEIATQSQRQRDNRNGVEPIVEDEKICPNEVTPNKKIEGDTNAEVMSKLLDKIEYVAGDLGKDMKNLISNYVKKQESLKGHRRTTHKTYNISFTFSK